MVDVSIILPVFNVEKYLRRSIESIIKQTYQSWEMILINDGSTDKSGEICDGYAISDSRIKVLHQENCGSGMARQKGLEMAKGDYICFVDPDDYLSINALSHNIKIMKEHNPQVLANGFNLITSKGNKKIKEKSIIPTLSGYYEQKDFRLQFDEYSKVGKNNIWNKLYNKEFIRNNNITFSSLPFGQDGDFNREVYRVLENIYIEPKAFYYYDASREGSAVKIYQENRLHYTLQRIKKEEKIFKEWNMLNKYENMILLSLLNALISEVMNLSREGSGLSHKDKIKKIEKYSTLDEFNDVYEKLKYSEVKNPFRKMALYLLKNKHYSILIRLINNYIKINSI